SVDKRSGPRKFWTQRRIEDTPIGADVALENFFRLIDGLDNIVVDAELVGLGNEVAQHAGLAERTRDGAFEIMTRTWPAKLPDDDPLPRICCTQFVVDRERSLDGAFLRQSLPIWDDVSEDVVHGVNEFWMVNKCLPVVGGCHRHRTLSLDAADNFSQFGRSVFMPEDCFIAHDQPGDVGVAPRQVKGGLDLALVSRLILIDPDAQRDR